MNLYHIVIVEDVPDVRNNLCFYFENNPLGFTVDKAFGNGSDALEYIKSKHETIDVVLTDIKMPKISGLDIAKFIYDNKLNIKTILISAYQEFEYAKKAIETDVFYFLTKPVQFDELDKVFTHLKSTLDAIVKIDSTNENLKKNLFAKTILSLCLKQEPSINEIHYTLKSIGFDIDCTNFPCCSVFLFQDIENKGKKWHYDSESFSKMLINFLHNKKLNFYVIEQKSTVNMLILPIDSNAFDNKEDFFLFVEKTITDAVENIKNTINTYVCFKNLNNYGSIIDYITNKQLERDEVSIKTSENTPMTKAVKYINEHYSQDISLTEISEYLGINPFYFSRLFKDSTNTTFTNYIQELRLNKAKEFLKNSDLTIKEIAISCGYYNEKYFMKIFKDKTGETPRTYRGKYNGLQ